MLRCFVRPEKFEIDMPPRLQRYIWRIADQAMPIGPPVFLAFLVLLLLVLNGLILLLR
jgi:hypothetical protein